MSKEKRRVPKLRFPGFTEDWEQRKLGTILSRRKENRLIDSAYPRLAFAAGQGVIPLSERRTNNRDQLISDEKNKKYLVTYYNDIVYNPANVKYGAIDRNKYGQGVISPIYVTFTSNVCSGFIEHIVKSNDFKQKALSFEEGTVTKRQAVNPDNLLNIDVDITLNIEEQKKISNLFELLGQYITLHQRKLDNLKLKKKALLQKLFPKNGERYPELRFPGFTDAWEQRKLGGYLIQYTEITTQNNQYPVLTSSRKGLFFQTDYYDGNQIASKDNTGYNIVPYGYFTYRHMSDDEIFHFNINYIVDKGIVSTLYPVFTTKNLNSNFLQLQLNYGNEFKKYAVLLKQGGSRTYMYFNKLKNLNLTISTSIDEQEIIAKFFILFEKLITLHQRKLEHLQLQKKALLQQLFI